MKQQRTKGKIALTIIGLALMVWASDSNAGGGLTNEKTYDELVASARQSKNAGELSKAKSFYIRAIKVRLFELPNTDLWLEYAELLCLLGDRKTAQDYLASYDQVLKIYELDLKCFTSLAKHSRNEVNPVIIKRVAEQICHPILIDQYLSLEENFLRDWIASERDRLSTISAGCERKK